ncbi:MAG: DUF1015 domain-containing protein [Candidatus Hydrogenedentes bacterium]|nr:DUF1015 domain-containing protein [Candidatus Hydrogenedentota bacterium]
MAEVRGFRGFRYNAAKVGSFDKVVTPPFDVISPEERAELIQRSPYNYARIIRPDEREGLTKYEAAAGDFSAWLHDDVFLQDAEESFYLLEQKFRSLDGTAQVRRGFFAVTRIPEPGDDTVLGHERTFEAKVTDRLRLTESTQANLGAVFALYEDPGHELAGFLGQMDQRPEDLLAHTIDNVEQRLWRVPADPRVTAFFAGKRLYIADGHHRYRTACTYRDQMRLKAGRSESKPYDYVLMGFVALEDPGLFVYPAHRVLDEPPGFDEVKFLAAAEPWFEVEKAGADLVSRVKADPRCAIGLVLRGGNRYLLRLRDLDRTHLLGDSHGPAWRDLDVSVLHGGILERIMGLHENAEFVYEKDVDAALALVDSGHKGMAFILRNMDPGQVCACAEARESMPQKATYFFPKLPSGAVLHRLV